MIEYVRKNIKFKTYLVKYFNKLVHFIKAETTDGDVVEEEHEEEEEESDETKGKKELACEHCPKKFKQAWKLRQHLIAHARQEEMKKYECDKCAATFMSEWLLVRHAKIHAGLYSDHVTRMIQ